MFEYVLTLIIILLIVIIFVLVRKEHFSIKETYDDIKTTIKDKISSLTKSNDSNITIEDPIKNSLSEVINSSDSNNSSNSNNSIYSNNNSNNDIEIGIVNSKYSQSRSTYFTPTLFHPDYVDVINVLNSMTNSPNTVVFNKDGKR